MDNVAARPAGPPRRARTRPSASALLPALRWGCVCPLALPLTPPPPPARAHAGARGAGCRGRDEERPRRQIPAAAGDAHRPWRRTSSRRQVVARGQTAAAVAAAAAADGRRARGGAPARSGGARPGGPPPCELRRFRPWLPRSGAPTLNLQQHLLLIQNPRMTRCCKTLVARPPCGGHHSPTDRFPCTTPVGWSPRTRLLHRGCSCQFWSSIPTSLMMDPPNSKIRISNGPIPSTASSRCRCRRRPCPHRRRRQSPTADTSTLARSSHPRRRRYCLCLVSPLPSRLRHRLRWRCFHSHPATWRCTSASGTRGSPPTSSSPSPPMATSRWCTPTGRASS